MKTYQIYFWKLIKKNSIYVWIKKCILNHIYTQFGSYLNLFWIKKRKRIWKKNKKKKPLPLSFWPEGPCFLGRPAPFLLSTGLAPPPPTHWPSRSLPRLVAHSAPFPSSCARLPPFLFPPARGPFRAGPLHAIPSSMTSQKIQLRDGVIIANRKNIMLNLVHGRIKHYTMEVVSQVNTGLPPTSDSDTQYKGSPWWNWCSGWRITPMREMSL